jgi:tetratricopeptide (TPR) repeat protein
MGRAGNPFDFAGRWRRRATLILAGLTFVTPCAILCATSPGDGNDGFVDIGGSCLRVWMIGICGGLALLFLSNVLFERSDHQLQLGSLTVFAAFTWVAAVLSVFARRHVEDQAGRMFAVLAAVSVVLLVLAAFDWGRRQLLIAAVVVAAVLSLFVVRVGFESLKVPPQWGQAQIVAQAQADEYSLELQYAANLIALRNEAVAATTALGEILTEHPAPSVDTALLKKAQVIHDLAGPLIAQEKAENAGEFSAFDALVADEPTSYPPGATTRLADAVRTLRDAENAVEAAAAAPASMTALGQAICAIAPTQQECGTGPLPATITTSLGWVTARHYLEVQLATYRAQVTGTPADQAALQAVLAQDPNADADITLLSAIQAGPGTLWRSAFHASGPALVPGPAGWTVLAVLLLGLLSLLLTINASQLAGPVSVIPFGSGTGDDKFTPALRVAVLQNVPEPGAAPGSPSTNPVTTLLGIAGVAPTAVTKIIQAIQAVAGRRYGYQVAIDVTSEDVADSSLMTGGAGTAVTNSAGITTVLVRVMSLSGVTYASHLCESHDEMDAVRTAGLWAAGDILNRSSRIPHWAAWEAETAQALVTAKNRAAHSISDLQAALAIAPNSGILLVLLGHRYELAGQSAAAIECYARAVTAYPRYAVARYRLAASLSTMRHEDFTRPRSPDQAESEDSMLHAVRAAAGKLKLDVGSDIRGVPDAAMFGNLAEKLLRSLECDTRWRYLLVDALRRSERKSVWPALAPMSKHPAARFPDLVRSARQVLSGDEHDCKKLDKAANSDGSWWQISYNAACRHADNVARAVDRRADGAASDSMPSADMRDEADVAMTFLEQTLVRPGIEQLSAEWVSRDPDLAVLRPFPRFKRFLAQLRPCE